MQYLIKQIEQKEYEGRKYAKVEVEALDGTELEASLGDKWGTKLFEIHEGDKIEANAWQNPKNGKWSLYPPEANKTHSGANYPNKTASITKAMNDKKESIAHFQDNKELSIKIASTMNKAVELSIASIGQSPADPDYLKEKILEFRKWLFKHWDDPETDATYPD